MFSIRHYKRLEWSSFLSHSFWMFFHLYASNDSLIRINSHSKLNSDSTSTRNNRPNMYSVSEYTIRNIHLSFFLSHFECGISCYLNNFRPILMFFSKHFGSVMSRCPLYIVGRSDPSSPNTHHTYHTDTIVSPHTQYQ